MKRRMIFYLAETESNYVDCPKRNQEDAPELWQCQFCDHYAGTETSKLNNWVLCRYAEVCNSVAEEPI